MIATVNVLGIGVHALHMQTAVQAIADAVLHHRKGYVCVCGVHGVMEARHDTSLANIFGKAFLVVPDGMPTVWMGRLQGYAIDRVFGPDLMLAVSSEPRLAGIRHYLYGGNPGVARQLREVLVEKIPGIEIVGTYCPPFRPLTLREQRHLLEEVDRLRPDIIWVGLSTPKQERFMAEFLPELRTTLMIGVGAAFDFHTGHINDSPDWLKRMGLQWLHRLIQEPSRLWRRYLVNNSQFVCEAFLQVAGLKKFHVAVPTVTLSVANESAHIHSNVG